MRSVSGTLNTAQLMSTPYRTPYIHMLFTSYDGNTTYDFSTDSAAYGNRILLIDHYEQSYNDYATVILKNHDKLLTTLDLRGYWVEIGYGDTTGGGNEYAATPRLWVKSQQLISLAGNLLMVLTLEGMWSKLSETLFRVGSPPFFTTTYTAETVYAILSALLTEAGFTLNALGGVDDGIINSYTPNFTINDFQRFESGAEILYRLIKMTYCYLRPLVSLEFKVVHPQAADAVDITYHNYKAPYFYEYAEYLNLVVPNVIYLFANAGADGLWTGILAATATDTDSQGMYGDVPTIELAPEITGQSEADNRAAVILARLKNESMAGVLIVPHDCRVELYDRIQVKDSRGATQT